MLPGISWPLKMVGGPSSVLLGGRCTYRLNRCCSSTMPFIPADVCSCLSHHTNTEETLGLADLHEGTMA